MCRMTMMIVIILFLSVGGIAGKEDRLESEEIMGDNPYFFPKDTQERMYLLEHTFLMETLPEKVNVSISKIEEQEAGRLYEIQLDQGIDFPESIWGDMDRSWLGYFFVTDNKIFLIRDSSPKIIMENASEEKLLNIGAVIVCQNSSKEDTLQDTEKGFHESITIEENLCIYRSYNNLVETGFYESFTWKKGIGLWEYRSGYGAGREHMEICLDTF